MPSHDATSVARLKAAGAIIIGKCNCDAFAMGSTSESSAYKVLRPCKCTVADLAVTLTIRHPLILGKVRPACCCRPPGIRGTWSGSRVGPQAAQQPPSQLISVLPPWEATQVRCPIQCHTRLDTADQMPCLLSIVSLQNYSQAMPNSFSESMHAHNALEERGHAGGSIRQPAHFCGVVGLKPTYGRVSRYGLIAYGSSLDCVGPLAGCVEDAALVLQAVAGECFATATTYPYEADRLLHCASCCVSKILASCICMQEGTS